MCIRDRQEAFELRYRSPKGVPVTLDANGSVGLIAGLGFLGKTLVTMVWDSSVALEARQPVLKGSVRAQATELKVPVAEGAAEPAGLRGKATEKKPETSQKENKKGDIEGKMKKWLGMKK